VVIVAFASCQLLSFIIKILTLGHGPRRCVHFNLCTLGGQEESENRKDERIENAEDGENVGPADVTLSHGVGARFGAADIG